jgi:hypothetical protein
MKLEERRLSKRRWKSNERIIWMQMILMTPSIRTVCLFSV